ncbi:HNH endonuclease [Spongiibacter tropicus]|uniref:HNH endonuclease n=1 Tax=Spongiibacter tropicus TaxID=454602 RepID=UPI0035BE2EBD
MSTLTRISVLLITLLATSTGSAHPGGVDANGGHTNRSTGQYHCHRDSCRAAQSQVEEATKEAEREGRAFSQIYRREDWPHWSDLDGDCMNTRHEILAASSLVEPRLSPDGCYVSSGHWIDPFGGETLTRASDLDVDHIIPLKWAHAHGGAKWSRNRKERFANDPDNLLAVDDALNQAKGAKGPDNWMPPNPDFHCTYLERWRHICRKYGLEMTATERHDFQEKLSTCEM